MAREQHFNSANGDRSDVRNVAILLSDGNDNVEVDNLENEVTSASFS